MIKIAVVSRQGAPVDASLAAQFDKAGGTIGRAPTNTLVLDDPERTVSRVHAQVVWREGQYFIVDRGSNPLLSNGRALGTGNEVPLAPGDRLVVGGFELVVEQTAAAVPEAELAGSRHSSAAAPAYDDPFADLLAGLGSSGGVPAKAHAPSGSAGRSADPLPFPNPLESGVGHRTAAPADPFADLLVSAPGASARAPAALDDFSDLGIPAAGKAASIDDLFGGGTGGIGGDPLALSPLADPLLQPNTAAQSDPFAALQGAARPVASPRSDHLPVGQFGYVPPKAVTPSAPLQVFDDETGLPIGATPADDPFADLMPVASVAAAPVAVPPLQSPPPVVRVAPAQSEEKGPASAVSDAELLAAFLRGLGSQHQPPEALTPGLMERIGQLLRASTEGTLQLLLTRQEFKREVRAEVTMIASQANNPLKFSPTAEVALAHLLGPGVRGFMPPEAAMKDAYNDLRSHQFGVMVGMRAALAHVIERFAPDELEKKIAAKSALDSLFAANRKAKLWDQFVALYGGIASEAEDDFHSLFGKAFLQAYEEQMERLKSGQ